MDDIRATVTWKPAVRKPFVEPIPAGWVIVNVDTGERIGSAATRYATEDEARAAIPGALAGLARNLERRAANDAQAAREEATAAARARQPRYTTVHSSAFGEGRIYAETPGATNYDDGSGQFNVQIWENS